MVSLIEKSNKEKGAEKIDPPNSFAFYRFSEIKFHKTEGIDILCEYFSLTQLVRFNL